MTPSALAHEKQPIDCPNHNGGGIRTVIHFGSVISSIEW